ncbi:MAG: DUF3857 domain-containing protein [Fusobacteria bacterium]|nr:DUF3857 domain-containing protein [Fusobacteriota bacterium]
MKNIKKITLLLLIILINCSLFSLEIRNYISTKDMTLYSTNTDRYLNSEAVILLENTEIKINIDNSYEVKKRIVIKINSYKGKKDYSEYKILYDKRFETIEIIDANTVKSKDGLYTILKTDENNIRDIDSPYDSNKMEYAVNKMKIIAFSGVEEGDILDLEYIVRNNKKDKFVDKNSFGEKIPIISKLYSLTFNNFYEPSINIHNNNNFIKQKEFKSGNNRTIQFTAENIDKIQDESSLPEISFFIPTVFVSFYDSYSEYKDLIWNMYKDKIKITDSILKIVKNEILETDSDKEKIIKLKKYIAKNIEQKKINHIMDFAVKDVDTTIKTGYGSIFDRAVLYLSLLKAVNIDGNLVLIGQDNIYFNEYMDYLYVDDFNYFLVNVNLDNKDYFFELESEFYEFGEINCINEMGLLIDPNRLKFVDVSPYEEYRSKTEYNEKIEINLDGDATVNRKISYTGINAKSIREKYYYMTPIKRSQDYEMLLNSISYDITPISEIMEISYNPAIVSYSYKHNGFLLREDNFLHFTLYNNIAPYRLIEEAANRNYPYISFEDSEINRVSEIILPFNIEIITIPENININNKYFIIKREVLKKENSFIIKDSIKYKPFVITNKEYGNFFNIVNSLWHYKNNTFVFKTK